MSLLLAWMVFNLGVVTGMFINAIFNEEEL